MVGDRAYLVTRDRPRTLRALATRARRRPPAHPGRHRLGSKPGLRHCREYPSVAARLAQRRADTARPRVPNGAVLMLVLLVLTTVSAWFVATGAVAFAGIIAH